jgi:hypothetical protein
MTHPLASAYMAALAMMQVTGPSDLHATANFAGRDTGLELDDSTLRDYLNQTGPNDPLHMDLRLKFADWDHMAADVAWADGTQANTNDRRALINVKLRIGIETAELMASLFPVADNDAPVVIATLWDPWYTSQIKSESSFYWAHYSRYLGDQRGWGGSAIAALDVATDRVVERLSAPTRPEAYQAKGLVVGYVQSGKTANFTGVIAKAVDIGYRLIIVLTGTTDLLRSQTQRRLDMELVGQENILRGINPEDHDALDAVDYYSDDPAWPDFVSHGFRPSDGGKPDIHRLTTRDFDFKSLRQGISALDFERSDRTRRFFDAENLRGSDARLIVLKKNATVLSKLVRDLKKITARLGDIPALIIDDESDQASINTKKPKTDGSNAASSERSAINGLISDLLGMLPRAQYIGYTATPFASVFIDPSDVGNVFPRDFIISLRRPPGYMGASDFHDLNSEILPIDQTYENSHEKAHVRLIPDRDDTAESEKTLRQAIDAFVLTGAVKLYRVDAGYKPFKHHTMLAHEVMQRVRQREQADQITHIWNGAGYYSPDSLPRLQALYESDIQPVSEAISKSTIPQFEELMPFVSGAIERIGQSGNPVLVVNSDKIEGEELDFDRNEVWRILVGGNKFARGFTVEGLTISYFGRSTRYADTLMQMGRWFGFREGYRDLVRLYTTASLYEAFEAVCLDENYFRREIAQYADFGPEGRPRVIPAEVPPLVASHLQRIRPAAPNRMYNAVLSQRRTRDKEPTGYPRLSDKAALASNTKAFIPVLTAATENPPVTLTHDGRKFEAFQCELPHADILTVLKSLRWDNEECFRADLAWLDTLQDNEVDRWIVQMPQLKKKTTQQARIGGYGPFSLHPRAGADYLNVKTTVDDRREIEALVRKPGSTRGGMLVYPMIKSGAAEISADIPQSDLVMAFRLTLPLTAAPADGRLVTFRVRDKTRWPNDPIVDVTEVL